MVGLANEHGRGVAQSHELAAEWVTKAAQKGNEIAQYHLGRPQHSQAAFQHVLLRSMKFNFWTVRVWKHARSDWIVGAFSLVFHPYRHANGTDKMFQIKS